MHPAPAHHTNTPHLQPAPGLQPLTPLLSQPRSDPLQDANTLQLDVARFTKNEEERQALAEAVRQSFLFDHLTDDQVCTQGG